MLEFNVPVRGGACCYGDSDVLLQDEHLFIYKSIESFQVPFQPKAIQAGISPGRGTGTVHLLEKLTVNIII